MGFAVTGSMWNAAPKLHHGMLLRITTGGIAGDGNSHANGHVKSSTFPAGAIWRRPAPELIKTKDRGLLMLLQPPSLWREAGQVLLAASPRRKTGVSRSHVVCRERARTPRRITLA